MRRLVVSGVALALVTLPVVARAGPDVKACLAASEKGQQSRSGGKLREAHEHFLVCGSDSCPGLVRRDCTQWNAELAAAAPTVVFGAHDKQGHDLFDVTVSMDGEVLLKKLDGKAVTVDPGPHTFRFEHPGFSPVMEKVLVKEGEKARVFNVTFDGGGGAGATSSSASDPGAKTSEPMPSAERGSEQGHTIFPWLVVGAGGALVVVGAVIWASSPERPVGCVKSTRECTRDPGESDEDFRARQETAGTADSQPLVGIGVLAGGLVLGGAGLLWHFLEPSGKKSAGLRVAPWTTGKSTGVTLGTTF